MGDVSTSKNLVQCTYIINHQFVCQSISLNTSLHPLLYTYASLYGVLKTGGGFVEDLVGIVLRALDDLSVSHTSERAPRRLEIYIE